MARSGTVRTSYQDYSEAQELKNESIRSDSPLDITQFRLREVEKLHKKQRLYGSKN